MQMLAVSSLMTASHAVVNMFSPSRNPCMKRVAPTRFRHDPYSACVLPANAILESPVVQRVFASVAVSAPAPVASAEPMKHYVAAAAAVSPAKRVATAAPQQQQQAAVKAPAVRFAIVNFKQESATFIAPFKISAGDLVVVEGDRGENIGVVAEIVAEKPTYNVQNKVVRRATDADREQLATQRKREAAAVKAVQVLADSLGLRAKIEDAEFQFDMNKLTVFVRRASKNAFVDFRKLQRGLFREFRCRIWCAYMDEVEEARNAPRYQ